MLKRSVLLCCLLLVFLQLPSLAARRIDMGERFPEVALPQPTLEKERKYLELPEGETFTLSQVGGELVLVEVLNVLCPHCQKQTLPYNRLFKMIARDPQTRGRILMLGIAVGNTDEQIEDFIDIYAVKFPIVSDRSFTLHSAIGGGPTPFSVYLRMDKGHPAVVAGTHLGVDRQVDELFAYLKEAAMLPVSEFADLPQDDEEQTTDVEAFLPPDLMAERVKTSFADFGQVTEFEELQLPSRRRVYRALVDGRPLFAEVLARSAICDICHDVHFYYLFDAQGKVLAFDPLHLTRYGNIEWNAKETAKMRKRVIGGYLGTPWHFDPQVDAVSRATMTSAIIFNSLDQGKALLQELEQGGYLNGKAR